VASPALVAQSTTTAASGQLTAVSDIRSDWLEDGVESPNGRMYLFGSYAPGDSGFLRYDRVKRSWAHLGRGNGGAQPRWSPDGRFVAFLRRTEESRDWHVWIVPMDTVTGLASGPARRVSMRPCVGPANGPAAWSPDGRRIAFIARDSTRMSVVAVPFNGGDDQVLFEATNFLSSVVWSRDGRSIFVNHVAPGRPPGRTLRVSLEDKRAVELGDAIAPIIDISPDGKWLAQFQWFRSVLHLVATDGTSARRIDLPSSLGRLTPAGWSHTNPNEFIVLDHFAPAGIQRVAIDDGRIRTVVAFDSGGLGGAELSPDQRQLAFIRLRDGVTQLVVSDTSGGNVRVLVNGAANPLWSPNGQYIAYQTTDSDIRAVEVATKTTHRLIPPERTPCPLRAPNCTGHFATPVQWRSDARAIRYFERRATPDGLALELHEVDLAGRPRLVVRTNVPGNPSFITGNDTLFLVQQAGASNGTAKSIQSVNSRTGAARVIYTGVTRFQEKVASNGPWIFTVAESGGDETPLLHQPLLVSLSTGEAKKYPYTLGGEVSHGYFLPDGRNLLLIACVTCRDPRYVEKWDLILTPMNGDPPRILTGSESSFKDFWPVGVTSDGRTAFFTAEQSYNTRVVTFALPK
jgi:Tol biopolymer transport system component